MDLTHYSRVQRAGQRMMVGFDGTELDDTLRYYIDQLGVGGIILFARNLTSPDQMTALCRSVQDYAHRCGHPPLFIGIDQEGGVVSRLKPPFTQFEGQPSIQTHEQARRFAQTTAGELRQVGVNMNMSPVLDVLPEDGPSVMQDRSFGKNPEQVASLGTAIIDCFQENRIMAVAKHFPGIGRTVLDSHFELPDLDTDAKILHATDAMPFEHAIGTHVAGIMLSHIRYRAIDSVWPASLSPAIVLEMLRNSMGYQGVAITDDLDMGAIAKHYTPEVIAAQCMAATIDILLICHAGERIDDVHRHLVRLDQQNPGLSKEADASLARIGALKSKYLKVS